MNSSCRFCSKPMRERLDVYGDRIELPTCGCRAMLERIREKLDEVEARLDRLEGA